MDSALVVSLRGRIAELEAADRQRRAILESVVDFAIIVTDHDGTVTDWNSGAERILGWSSEEMCGQTAERFFTPEDRAEDRVGVEMRCALEHGRASDERWHLKKAGSRFWASGEMMPLRNDADQHIGYVKVLWDRTAQHQTREALAATEHALRRAQEAGGVGVFTVDLVDHTIHPTPEFCRLYGHPECDDLPAAEFERLILPEDAALVSNADTRVQGNAPLDVEYRIRRADTGEIRWIARKAEIERDEAGRPVRFIGVARDVTEQRTALAELEGREAQLRSFAAERNFIIDLTARQLVETDPDRIMSLSARALGEWLGVNRVGFYRMTGSDTLRYGASWTDGTMTPLQGEQPADDFGRRIDAARHTGAMLSFSDSRHDPEGGLEPLADRGVLAGVCLPLQTNDRWYAGLYVHSGAVRPWSTAEIALIREVAGLTWLAVDRAEALLRLEDRVTRQDEHIVRVSGDLREQREGRSAAESQLRQLQKMEAVGQLTGGIAHDFNNMLAVIIGGLNLADLRLARGDTDIKKYLDGAMEGATRAAALTQRLLAFSRQQPLSPEPIDVTRLVTDMSGLLSRTLGEAIRLEMVGGAGLWKAKADPNQLENVIINLCVNARDAMPGGGRLTIETTNIHVDDDYATDVDIRPGQYVMIAVSDTGTGMSEEVLAKAFDPFFTTKGVGKGTGLGLSQVFGFVRQSGGNVRVYSELGHGTTFKIFLPRYWGDAVPTTGKRPGGQVRRGEPHEIVLVVEDEDRVRNFSVETLRELGYTVIHAASGPEALSLIDSGQDVTLLFTDIVMPEMTGRQLADLACERLPHLKVVYTTGYTRNAVVHNGVIDPGTNYLAKPFNIDQVATIIRTVLDSDD